jgi:ATP-dependent Clp protease adaptor protein ClpS
MNKYAEQTDLLVVEKTVETQKLVIYNDDYNTFDWVIEALVDVCKHSTQQAEQCSLFIHTLGKYAVKEGSFKVLKPMKEAILERGISAVIE